MDVFSAQYAGAQVIKHGGSAIVCLVIFAVFLVLAIAEARDKHKEAALALFAVSVGLLINVVISVIYLLNWLH